MTVTTLVKDLLGSGFNGNISNCLKILAEEQNTAIISVSSSASVAPPSMFRDLAVRHFRPVPFRILDRSSVPFHSAPFRKIVTTVLENLDRRITDYPHTPGV